MKKIKIIVLSSLGGLLALAVLFFLFTLFLSPVFDMTVSLPQFPESAQIYKTVKPDVTLESVRALGAKFGLTGQVGEDSENYFLTRQETHELLHIYKATGAISYTRSLTFRPEGGLIFPSDDEAAAIAVNKLRETGLLPEGKITTGVRSGGTDNLIVSIKHPLEEHPQGGTTCNVRIGHLGEVISVSVNPVKYVPWKMAQLKPVRQAYQELKQTRRKYTGVNARWVSINDVSLSYWIDPENRAQEYVYPVYVFSGYRYEFAPLFDRHPSGYLGWANATEESSIQFPAVCGAYNISPLLVMEIKRGF